MKIGIFDSGKGGEFVHSRLKTLLPDNDYIVINDRTHVPYGDKMGEEIILLTDVALQQLIGNCDVVVLACNTATSHAITWLREKYPSQLFVGYEPMLKPASLLSKKQHITMLATRATKHSKRYRVLKKKYAANFIIDLPDTDSWAVSIETNQTHLISFDEVERSISSGSDTIVLACTHYLALQEKLEKLFPTVRIIEPTPAVALRITALAAQLQR